MSQTEEEVSCPLCGKKFSGPTARYYLGLHIKYLHDEEEVRKE